MINLRKVWVVAQTEGRLTRRLARYWVFLVLAYGVGLLAFFYYSAIHAFVSAFSSTVGLLNPRYLVSAIGTVYLTGFSIGIVFLGFDVRARDVRENIDEVLDARPLTNLELVAGRFIGLLISAWVPVLGLAVLLQTLGWLLPLLGSPLGRTIEPASLLGFVFAQAIPGMAFCFALVFLITLLVRHRLIAALLSVATLVLLYWAAVVWPAIWVPYIDFLGMTMMEFPSDIVPDVMRPEGWLQRFGYLVIALGLVGLAAVVHPRLDGGRRGLAATLSAGILVVGLLALVGASQQRVVNHTRVEVWASAHKARAAEPVPDIRAITASVNIDPGRDLTVVLQMQLQAPPEHDLDHLLLTLNPGLSVDRALLADGAALAATHENGLLEIKLNQTLRAGESMNLELAYHGVPEAFFAYLDSTIKLTNLKATDAQVGILGYEPAIFDRRYVALMPGIYWLPAAGVDTGREDTRQRRRDYFSLDLEVQVPSAWTVAGPGKRESLGDQQGQARYRFAPVVALSEAALLASEFNSYATEVSGISFEVLLYPGHTSNMGLLADVRGEVEQWLADRLEANREAGLNYPFDAFSLVEVPNTLRSYKGGWRLNTAMAPPAMVLMRESSFPTARFDFDIGNSFGNKRDFDQEGGKPRIDRDRLISFFNNDVSGGNLFTGAAQSIYAHRTSAYGPEAIALDFTLEELSTLTLSGQRSYFSAHLFTSINQSVVSVIAAIQGRGATSVSDALITAFTTQTKVWDAVLQSPLANLDPFADPQRTIDILTLKGGKMAQAFYDSLGQEDTGKLLSQLVEQHAGSSFTRADLVAAADSVGANLGPMLDDWFNTTNLPGFAADNVRLYRLPDTGNGESAYQLLLRLRNDEPATGFARVAWAMTADGERTRGDPIRLDGRTAIDFGVVLSEPPAAVYIEPYLSLNRENFLVQMLNKDNIPDRKEAPVNGVTVVPWDSGSDDRIIVDDLDPGFSVSADKKSEGLRLLGRGIEAGTDQGLPVATGQIIPPEWYRRPGQNCFGRYRHTLAYIRPGKGDNRAVMTAQIPQAGNWELEFFLPYIPFIPPERRGTYQLTIVSADGSETASINSNAEVAGWNLIGEYYLPAGEVRVELSDKTDGMMVIADAIAWSPVHKNNNETPTGVPGPSQ